MSPRRKPTFPERVELAMQAQYEVVQAKEIGDDREPYVIAFEKLGTVRWLHAQSRDGVAAEVARAFHAGTQPYEGVDINTMELARRGWLLRHPRRLRPSQTGSNR